MAYNCPLRSWVRLVKILAKLIIGADLIPGNKPDRSFLHILLTIPDMTPWSYPNNRKPWQQQAIKVYL